MAKAKRLGPTTRLRQLRADLRFWQGQARLDARAFRASRAHVRRLEKAIDAHRAAHPKLKG